MDKLRLIYSNAFQVLLHICFIRIKGIKHDITMAKSLMCVNLCVYSCNLEFAILGLHSLNTSLLCSCEHD